MGQPAGLGDGRAARHQGPAWKAETEKDDAQIRLRYRLGVESDLMDKRAVGGRIIKRQRLFEMRSG